MKKTLIALVIAASAWAGGTVSVEGRQGFNAQIQAALNALGYVTSSGTMVQWSKSFLMAASSYINFGSTSGVNGYGIRDSAGNMQYKNSGGAWIGLPSGGNAPIDATYITQIPNATLTNEQALSVLGTAILLNHTGDGVVSAYTGTSCTNQFTRSLNAIGVATCATVSLTADVTGILPTANGGTGIAYFTVAGPTTARVYTFPDAATTILTTNAAVTPAQGGTGIASYAVGDLLYASGATTLAKLADIATGNVLLSGGVTTAPAYGKVTSAHVDTTIWTGTVSSGLLKASSQGVLAQATAGTDYQTPTGTPAGFIIASQATGDLLQASSATAWARLAAVATGSVLCSAGTGTVSAWCSTPTISITGNSGTVTNGLYTNVLIANTAFGLHTLTSAGTGNQSLMIRNTTAGTGNATNLFLGNDASDTMGRLIAYSSTFATSGWEVADAITLQSVRAGGLNLVTNAGPINFYANNGTTITMALSGTGITIPALTAASGVNYICVSTTGLLSRNNTACVGTDAEAIASIPQLLHRLNALEAEVADMKRAGAR